MDKDRIGLGVEAWYGRTLEERHGQARKTKSPTFPPGFVESSFSRSYLLFDSRIFFSRAMFRADPETWRQHVSSVPVP